MYVYASFQKLWIWKIKIELSKSLELQAKEIGAQINNFPVEKAFSCLLFSSLEKRKIGNTDYIKLFRNMQQKILEFEGKYPKFLLVSPQNTQLSPSGGLNLLSRGRFYSQFTKVGKSPGYLWSVTPRVPLVTQTILLLVWRLCSAVQTDECSFAMT